MKNYRVIIEKAKNNYSAYSPDVPNIFESVSTGKTRKLAMKDFMEALEFHLKGLKEDCISHLVNDALVKVYG